LQPARVQNTAYKRRYEKKRPFGRFFCCSYFCKDQERYSEKIVVLFLKMLKNRNNMNKKSRKTVAIIPKM